MRILNFFKYGQEGHDDGVVVSINKTKYNAYFFNGVCVTLAEVTDSIVEPVYSINECPTFDEWGTKEILNAIKDGVKNNVKKQQEKIQYFEQMVSKSILKEDKDHFRNELDWARWNLEVATKKASLIS